MEDTPMRVAYALPFGQVVAATVQAPTYATARASRTVHGGNGSAWLPVPMAAQ
jgi:hypothetical protein